MLMPLLPSHVKLWGLFVLAVLPIRAGRAQFTDPRNYENFPVGVNQVEVTYSYARANASIDPSIIIAGAHLNLNQWTLSYTRYFSLFRRMAWVAPSIPLAVLDGEVSGTNISGSVAGAGDTGYEFAWLLKGAPALSPSEFEKYKPTTVVGVSVNVTAPTGLYSANKILNLGSDRWSFRPEIALSHPFGSDQKWAVDAYANTYIYTDNTHYRGVEILRQGPLPAFEGHLSYAFRESIVGSFDARYSFRGDTSVNGVGQDNSQKNFVVGSEWIVSLNNKNQFTFIFEKAAVHVNGPAVTGLAVRYDYYWGRGYK